MDATEAAVHFAKALSAAQVPYAIGGAIAYGFFGVARGTYDVDINLFVEAERAAVGLDALIAAGLEIDRSAALDSAVARGDARGHYGSLPVDLFFNSIPAHERAAARVVTVTLHGVSIRILSAEDTVIFKMLFFRGKDLVDVERLLGLAGPALDRDSVRAALLETVGADDYRTKKWDDLCVQLPA